MTKFLAALGKGILYTAALIGMLALVLFALAVALMTLPYKKASKGKFSAMLDAGMAAGSFFAASSFLAAELKKQPEMGSTNTTTKPDGESKIQETSTV